MKLLKTIVIIFSIILLININKSYAIENVTTRAPTVELKIEPHSLIYEGDIIDCEITGYPIVKYWSINNQTQHKTFYENKPVIFDPEPTPLDKDYVDLTVHVENSKGYDSDTVQIKIKRIYFGDIHWHTNYGDGLNHLKDMYENAINDNYLDFAASSEHAINNLTYCGKPFPIIKMLLDYIKKQDPWNMIKNMAVEYNNPGNFTTLLGYEYSVSTGSPGGYKWSEAGHEDVSHINFYYKEVYPNALRYNSYQKLTYDDILKAMSDEWDKGHYNIGFPHHPLGKIYWKMIGDYRFFKYIYTVNWSYLAKGMENKEERDKILRGVEVYSRWGTAIGKYSGIPITWPYLPDEPPNQLCIHDQEDAWVENAMWEWSDDDFKGKRFVMQAGSDTHYIDRPGSAALGKEKVSGIIAAYAVHNNRSEIWDAMNECEIYGSQLLKIRANVRIEDKFVYGKWINCTSPLNINITVHSTFSGEDSSGKSMCPHAYSTNQLDFPISDIWIVKKDTDRGRPWCKVIYHATPNENLAVINFEDSDIKPNDFYYVAIRQKGQNLIDDKDEYMAYIGPVFIEKIIE